MREEIIPELLRTSHSRPDPGLERRVRRRARRRTRLAICLAEALGQAEFRRRVKIYATDVDEEALDRGPPGAVHRA